MRRKKNPDDGQTELNLVPIMNLFTALIPFLLLSAAFIQVKVINASTPAIADGSQDEDVNPDPRPVVVNVQVAAEGYVLSASGDDVLPEELEDLNTHIGGYDLKALQEYLKTVKSRFPKSDTVIIVPALEIRYEEIIRVMDTSREENKRTLFPRVVVTSLVQ